MKAWKQYALINVAAAIGLVGSLFFIPKNTTIRMWATISICVILTMNFCLYVRRKRQEGSTTADKWRITPQLYFGFALMALYWILQFLWR